MSFVKKLIVSRLFISVLFVFSVKGFSRNLRVGISTLDYAPYYFQKDGKYYGAAMEISQQIAKNLGHELTIVRYPWKRIQSFLQSGKVDMVILYFKTEKRANHVYYTNTPILYESSDLFVSKKSDISAVKALTNLMEYPFYYVGGYSHGKEFNEATYLKKKPLKNEKSLIKVIAYRGMKNIGVGSKPVILFHAKMMGLENQIKFLKPSIDKSPNYIAFSKKTKGAKKISNHFNSELKRFKTTPAYLEVTARYGLVE